MTERHSALSGRHILVVEDEGLIALDMMDILIQCGCTVVGPVTNAAAALALIGKQLPDGAVLDVHINGGTSEPVARALSSAGKPFVVLTAYPQTALSGALKNAPLLRKPVEEDRLKAQLEALFASPKPL